MMMMMIMLCEGDAVGIYPENSVELIDEIIQLAGWQHSQLVDVPANAYQPVDGTASDLLTHDLFSSSGMVADCVLGSVCLCVCVVNFC